MSYLRFVSLSLFLVFAVAPAQSRPRATTVIVHVVPGTTRPELQRQLPAGTRVTGWMPEIAAAVVVLPLGQSQAPLAGDRIRSIAPDQPVHLVASGPDPLIPRQYGLAKTEAPAAWNVSTGRGTIVAVVDTGITATHPDLATQLWRNPREIPGNGIDDDGNGFVDDVNGWHFYHDSLDGTPQNDGNIGDSYGHGTHVAGIVGAARGNAEGGAGIAPDTRLMILRVFGTPTDPTSGDGRESDIALAILYATAQGANVINLSLGGDVDVPVLHQAIQYAVAHGVVVVAAAGNNGTNFNPAVEYPGSYPEVMAVAATDSADQRAAFSAFGPAVSLSAPGVGVLSTAAPSGLACVAPGNAYAYCSGTSMAAPFVSGAAALLKATHPCATAGAIRTALERSADDIGAPGRDDYTGWGRLNAARAVTSTMPLALCITTYLPLSHPGVAAP